MGREHRQRELAKVFQAFDLDKSGKIEPDELMILGQMRQELGHKERLWTEAMNAKLMSEMDTNGDGKAD